MNRLYQTKLATVSILPFRDSDFLYFDFLRFGFNCGLSHAEVAD
jgi:hypothetical protein